MASFPSAGSPAPFPERVGKYELLLPIGTGGMATVYLARTTGAGGFTRDVALKLVHAHLRADEESKLQLLEEAKLAARIRHPNVVPVHEVDEDPFGVFLVMDYVEGDNLSGVVRGARAIGEVVSNRLFARVLNDALLGLHAAHELRDIDDKPLNLVHRDFSPQNILLSNQGNTRLGDFGVAKAADRAIRTKTGLVKGKISYMSPEQARGHGLDRRCDVWAAGVVAWELFARRRMHTAEDDVTTLLRIVTEAPPRLSSAMPDIPPAVDDAVAWALAPHIQDRCPTAEAFRLALEAAWEPHGGMATVSEVADFVERVVGPRLRERQASIAEVRTLRLRMEELVRTHPSELERTPSEKRPRAQQRSYPRITPVPTSTGSVRPPSSSRPSLVTPLASSVSPPLGGEPSAGARSLAQSNDPNTVAARISIAVPPIETHADRTEMSAEVPAHRPAQRSRRWTVMGSALLGASVTLGVVWVVNSLRVSPDASLATKSQPASLSRAPNVSPVANGEQATPPQRAVDSPGAAQAPAPGPASAAQALGSSPPESLPPLSKASTRDKSAEDAAKPAPAPAPLGRANKSTARSEKSPNTAPTRTEKSATSAPVADPKSVISRPPNRKPGLASSPYPGAKSSL
jgi:eukaryotic-like serine/threonine-protein kinase